MCLGVLMVKISTDVAESFSVQFKVESIQIHREQIIRQLVRMGCSSKNKVPPTQDLHEQTTPSISWWSPTGWFPGRDFGRGE